MAESHDDDQQNVVLNCVHDAVVANTHPETRSAVKRSGSGWARIFSEQSNRTSNSIAILMIYSPQRANCGRSQLDAIGHIQPRSALT